MIYKMKNFETERLIVRRSIIEDFYTIYEYNLAKLQDDSNLVYEKYDRETIRSWFPKTDDEYQEKHKNNFVIEWTILLKNGGELLGTIRAEKQGWGFDKKDNEIELDVSFRPRHWGNGYAKEAMEPIIDFLFELGYQKIYYRHKEYNNKSKRLVEKLNFNFDKIIKSDLRDDNDKYYNDYLYSLDYATYKKQSKRNPR